MDRISSLIFIIVVDVLGLLLHKVLGDAEGKAALMDILKISYRIRLERRQIRFRIAPRKKTA